MARYRLPTCFFSCLAEGDWSGFHGPIGYDLGYIVFEHMNDTDLTFSDFLSNIDQLGRGEWVIAYESRGVGVEGPVFYSALIREDQVTRSLEQPSWDLRIGSGLPGFSFRWDNGQETAEYRRPSDDGVEPLVLWRSFNGIREGYWEISEEFRLYFNLWEDRTHRRLILIDDNGDEEDAVVFSEQDIKIKLRLIREFLAAKKMRLALFFDFNRFSERSLPELGLAEYHEIRRGNDFVLSIGAKPWISILGKNHRSHGFLIGKKLIPAATDFKPSIDRREERQYVDFIIGVDDYGNPVSHTCNEERLANYFGKNPGAPQYVTPVFFRRDVLTKYYSQPAKYSVEDGHLLCGALWSLRIDNNHSKYVIAFLGDLGHLSYVEQLHWRSFNVSSGQMSRTGFERAFEGQFTEPEDPALFFKQKLASFQEKWKRKFGWELFRPLSEGDEHYFKTLRVPLTSEQREFDEQVLALTKVLIDSLNEEQLEREQSAKRDNSKGIEKLEGFLTERNLVFPEMIEFLRKLQSLRSTSAAHRKGRNYEKIKTFFSIGTQDLPLVFGDILQRCIWTLNTLEKRVL